MEDVILVIFGRELIFCDDFCDYVLRRVRECGLYPKVIARLERESELKNLLKIYSHAVLVCERSLAKDFGLENTAQNIILELWTSRVNVIFVDSLGQIPMPILGQEKENLAQKRLYLIGIEPDSALMLLPSHNHGVKLEILPQAIGFSTLLASAQKETLEAFLDEVNLLFGERIFSADSLAQKVVELLAQNGAQVATAESCTGGKIAASLTEISGASAVFHGGVISYDNAIKQRWLGVDGGKLADYGAVSEAVVSDMLSGVLRISGAQFALAVSGVAGPSGGSVSKPVGTVFIGACEAGGVEIIERMKFNGDRLYIQSQAIEHALYLLLRVILRV